jgi:uncharacterized damage-inducible protein DinB
MPISQMLLPEIDRETSILRKLLERVPDDKLTWKPHDRSMTLGRLASHCAELPGMAIGTVKLDKLEFSGDRKPYEAASAVELVETLDKNVAGTKEALAGASDEHLMQPWSLILNGNALFTMPRAAVLRAIVINHMIHHRGQLSVYLRMLDVKIPSIYGPSADEMS